MTLPMALTLSGRTIDIYRFLSLLQQRLPVVSIPTVGLGGLDAVASAQVQLVFYFLPEASPDEEEAQ